MPKPTEFAGIVHRHLYQRGLTQEQLAQQVSVAPESLSRVMRGTRNPGPELVLAISHALALPPEEEEQLLIAAGYKPDIGRRALTGNARIAMLGDTTVSERLTRLSRLEGDLWSLFGGIPTDILPMDPSYEERRLEEFPDPGSALRIRRRLQRVELLTRKLDKWKYRYLIPSRAIERYANEGVPSFDEFEAARPDWRADPGERKQRIKTLVDMLKHPNFELGLLDTEDFDIWYNIYAHKAVLMILRLGKPHTGLPFNGIHIETFDPETVWRFEFNHQRQWDSLPRNAKDKGELTSWLQSLVNGIS